MRRILHVSDLHLGEGGAWETGDYGKSELLRPEERQTRHGLLEGTLRAFAELLSTTGDGLDALIVSGDVTYQAARDGFEALPALLANLEPHTPAPEHTVVVPGNHDVKWGAEPGTEARYRLFIDHVRNQGYVTPLLEGIDVGDDGRDLGTGHNALLQFDDVVIAAINSADHCGVLEALSHMSEDDLLDLRQRASTGGDDQLASLLKELDVFRMVDLCRVSEAQMIALGRQLREAAEASEQFRFQIGVLHHQVLPVSPNEELKRFESMTNLGHFRQWIASAGFHLLLHGHKHVGASYFDFVRSDAILRAGQILQGEPVLVSSAATVNEESSTELMRLVRIDTPGDSVRSAHIWSIPARHRETTLQTSDLVEVASTVALQHPTRSAVRIFEGATVDAVYDQLLAAYPSESFDDVDDVLCRIDDGATARRLPIRYPVPEGEDRDEWFGETVAWWQNPRPHLRPPQFNHGERIYSFAHDIDQLDAALSELSKSPSTSRGVIVILDPRPPGGPPRGQPAFCLVQFRVRRGQVDCVGYFRKQQMRAWWPINVGELAVLQEKACAVLGSGYRQGEILTFSAQTLGGSDRPRVVVPRIDRWAQDRPERLWDLVLATLKPDHPARPAAEAEWNRLFSDWTPGATREQDGAPVALDGLKVLADAVTTVAQSHPSVHADELDEKLRALYRENLGYWEADARLATDNDRDGRYDNWRPNAAMFIREILALVRAILNAGGGASAAADDVLGG